MGSSVPPANLANEPCAPFCGLPQVTACCVPLASGMSTHFISRPLKIGTFYFGRQATNEPVYGGPQGRDRPSAVPRPASDQAGGVELLTGAALHGTGGCRLPQPSPAAPEVPCFGSTSLTPTAQHAAYLLKSPYLRTGQRGPAGRCQHNREARTLSWPNSSIVVQYIPTLGWLSRRWNARPDGLIKRPAAL
jgi:hypothetical protein